MSGGMPQMPSGGASIAPPISPLPCVRVSMKARRSRVSATARRNSGLLNGGVAVDHHVAVDVGRHQLADRLRPLVLHVVQHRHLKEIRRGHVELAGREGQLPGRLVLDDRPFDAVEIGPVLFPVVGIARDLDVFVRLEFDELERSGADRMLPHVARGGTWQG